MGEESLYVFLGMAKKMGFGDTIRDAAARHTVGRFADMFQRKPWYNLRKGFCTDLIQVITDIPTYEHITDHSYKIAQALPDYDQG